MALLRGINVGGRNKLPMSALTEVFERAGCEDVRTYIQSGNVIFRAPRELARQIPAVVAEAIRERVGVAVPVVVRSGAQLRSIVAGNPLADDGDLSKVHVVFLADRPSRRLLASLDPDRSPPDRFVAKGSEVYLECPNGIARTRLTNAYFDAKLATVSTVRNWNTVTKLLQLARG